MTKSTLLVVFGILIGIVFSKTINNIFPHKCPCDEVENAVVISSKSDTTETIKTKVDSSKNVPVRVHPGNHLKAPKPNFAKNHSKQGIDSLKSEFPTIDSSYMACDDSIRVYENWSSDSSAFVVDSVQGKRLSQVISTFQKQTTITNSTITSVPPPKFRPSFFMGAGTLVNTGLNPYFVATLQTRKNHYGFIIDPLSNEISRPNYGFQLLVKIL